MDFWKVIQYNPLTADALKNFRANS
jgi:hypothetical protein